MIEYVEHFAEARLALDGVAMPDLHAAREQYLAIGEAPAGVRPMVLASWERCRALGVLPDVLRPQYPDPQHLARARAGVVNAQLLHAADPLLKLVHNTLADQRHVVALADAQGTILRLLSDPHSQVTAPQANIFEGASWHERDIGGNGVGTCLAEGRPIILIGPEHFQASYISWTCIGVPLRNAEGVVVGALDLSVPNEQVSTQTWGWTLSVASAIETALRQQSEQAVTRPELEDPLHAITGVLELLAGQLQVLPTHAHLVAEARHRAEEATGRLRAAVAAQEQAQQRLREQEQALRRSETRFREILENSLDIAYRRDLQTDRYDYISPVVERVLGFTVEQMCAMSVDQVLDHIHPDDRSRLREGMERSLRDGRGIHEYRFRTGNGDYRWLADHVTIQFDQDGRPRYRTGIVRDVTAQRRREEELRQSEDRFRTLADNIAQFAWMADPSGWIFWYNRRWFEYTGTTLEQMQGWGWKQVHHPNHVERVVEKISACFREGRDWEDVFPLRSADGQYRWFLSRAIPIRDERGQVQRWFGTNTDITELRRLEAERQDLLKREQAARAEAESASAAKDHFLAVLSHELRTPLTPVLLEARSHEGDPSLPEELRQSMAMIRRNIELETRLIDDLLDLTRISQNKLRLEVAVVDLHEQIRQVVEMCRADVDAHRLGVDVSLDAGQCHVLGDSARLKQVLWNLLRNAIRFTPDNGRIQLRTRNSDTELHIDVEDNGAGIEPELLGRIFGAFEQGSGLGGRRQEGMGLGLSIARGLIELHCGRITVHSDGPGRGSRFTVQLPLTAAVESSPAPPPSMPGDNGPVDCRILLVEDHDDTRRALARLLASYGCDVQAAHSMSAALHLAGEARFTLLISDIGLPDGSGLDLMRQLQQKHPIRGIALTGHGMLDDIIASQEAGFDEHLVKPIDPDRLAQVIRRLVQAG